MCRPEDVLSILEVNEDKPKKKKDRDSDGVSSLNPNQALIKRFNHYSIMILDACSRNSRRNARKEVPKEKPVEKSDLNAKGDFVEVVPDEAEAELKKRKHDLIEEKNHYEDLEGDHVQFSDVEWLTVESRPLKISDKSRYMEGPKATSSDDFDHKKLRMDLESLETTLNNWKPGGEWVKVAVKVKGNGEGTEEFKNEHSILRSTAAGFALNDLRPGGPRFESTSTTLTLPVEDQEQLKDINKSLNELLKHFWSCFPVINDTLHNKAASLYQSLKAYERKVLDPFKEKLTRDRLDNEVTNCLLLCN